MFAGNIFANGSPSAKFVKIFSCENFPLYGRHMAPHGKITCACVRTMHTYGHYAHTDKKTDDCHTHLVPLL